MNRRLRSTMICLVALGAMFPIPELHAEAANQHPEDLKKYATHIVVGKVTKITHVTTTLGEYDGIQHEDEICLSTAEFSVTAVEKGDEIVVGDVIKVRYWNRPLIERNPELFRSNGHRGVPKTHETTRVYLTKVKGRGYNVEFPNGFESIKPEPKRVKPEPKPAKPEAKPVKPEPK